MTIDQLRYFLAVEKYGTFSGASYVLHISQSSLSKQIKALERELDVLLFKRNTRNVSVTPAGAIFSLHAKESVDRHIQLLKNLKDHSLKEKSAVRVGAVPVLDQYGILDMIRTFQSEHPACQLSVIERAAVQVLELLDGHSIDLAILRNAGLPESKYKIYPFLKDELVFICSKNHPLAGRDAIHLSEVAQETFLFMSISNNIQNYCIEECKRAGFTPKLYPYHYDLRLRTVLKLVGNEIGVSLMMYKTAQYNATPAIKILRLLEPASLDIAIVARDEPSASVSNQFIKYAVNYFKK